MLTSPAELSSRGAGKRDGADRAPSPSGGESGESTQTKLFLMAAAWHEHAEDTGNEICKDLDTSDWAYDLTHGTAGLLKSIRTNLKSTGRPVADLIELFNFTEKEAGGKAGAGGGASRTDTKYFQVERAEFVTAFQTRLAFPSEGGEGLLREIFNDMDHNHDGVIDQGELFEFIAGRTLLLQRAEQPADTEKVINTMHLKPSFPKAKPLWSSDELRAELQHCLTTNRVAAHWLIEHWDEE